MLFNLIQRFPNWTRRLTIASLTAFGLALIIIALTPKAGVAPGPLPIHKNQDGTVSEFDRVIYDGSNLTLPEQLPHYPIALLDIPTLGEQLVTNLSLVSDEEIEGIWSSDAYSLVYAPQDKTWQLMANQLGEAGQTFDSADSNQLALTALGRVLPELSGLTNSLPLKAQLDQAAYLVGEYEQRRVSAELATQVRLPITQQTPNGYPLIVNNEAEPPISLTLNGVGEIRKLFVRNQFFALSPEVTTERPTLTINQALRNIERERASVVSAKDQEYREIDLSLIESANLQTVNLEYRAYPLGSAWLAAPFYRFSGYITTANKARLEAEIITPATEF